MANVSQAMQAKSDQLNYDDIGSGEIVIKVNKVIVTNTEQPVSIFYDGCNDKPYKPSKGMIRLISEAWGVESDCWIGKSISLYGDDSVKWAGKEIGGIRINAFSDINKGGISAFVALSRGKRRKVTVKYLEVKPVNDVITDIDQSWINAAKEDPLVLNQIEDLAYKARIEKLMDT